MNRIMIIRVLVALIVILVFWLGTRRMKIVPTRFQAAIEYLLAVLRRYFPGRAAGPLATPQGAFAGLRVLPAGGRAFDRSRETLLDVDRARRPRVLTIYGGKLTTWRAVAGKVLARIAPSLPQRRPVARTDELELRPP